MNSNLIYNSFDYLCRAVSHRMCKYLVRVETSFCFLPQLERCKWMFCTVGLSAQPHYSTRALKIYHRRNKPLLFSRHKQVCRSLKCAAMQSRVSRLLRSPSRGKSKPNAGAVERDATSAVCIQLKLDGVGNRVTKPHCQVHESLRACRPRPRPDQHRAPRRREASTPLGQQTMIVRDTRDRECRRNSQPGNLTSRLLGASESLLALRLHRAERLATPRNAGRVT